MKKAPPSAEEEAIGTHHLVRISARLDRGERTARAQVPLEVALRDLTPALYSCDL